MMVQVADVDVLLPHSSVAVKVINAEPVPPQRVLMEVKLLVQVTIPQLSVATAPPLAASHAFNWAVLPVPSQSTVRSEAGVLTTGAVLSMMVKVALVVEVFPHSSVAEKVTNAEPVAPQMTDIEVKSLLHVTFPQLSVAMAPPFAASHAFNCAALLKPSQTTVRSEAGVLITGGVLSVMVKVAVVVDTFPHSSVAEKATKAVPVVPQMTDRVVKSLLHVTFPQLSEAAAPPLAASHAFNWVVLPVPSQSTVRSEAGVLITGAVLSMMVKVAVVAEMFPHSSVAEKVTNAEPVAPQRSEIAEKSLFHATFPQLSEATAPPFATSHAFNWVVFPVPSQSNITAEAGEVISGDEVSCTIML